MNVESDADLDVRTARLIVTEAQFASYSLLQRRMRIGLAKAMRLIEVLEKQGVVGPADGAKSREVLVKR